ncbi:MULTISPECIES: YiiX/YebB-like N1pC/P60 family cysteine hydrolase [unclassified Lentimonas]|uniref:YiiX/YebB-like N1pC/P60 family cysteine hydrolase n=1 Tax=unclassified Lentimonas TaxID=2630993 RepID=UPI00132CAD11|nr:MULTISPECIES: YiiX/YebB-like N1pC/P60 family cysteine hydrolase [unclassified Lentimonas]CAA6693708.1 Unannotated [Lentimonas sp. CC10]CAA6696342.1 Unannotated [Lentimonas sp. CC19]CAA7071662.1 Unannotated [Lentimonas sp. CC11]
MQNQSQGAALKEVDVSSHIPMLLAAAGVLPSRESIEQYLDKLTAAEARGYFLPDEDEGLRELYSHYLALRLSLLECVCEVSGGKLSVKGTQSLPRFILAYAAACLLMRAGSFIVEMAQAHPIVMKKLDEPEPRFGHESKIFTRIYRSLTSPKRRWAFFEATRYYEAHRSEIVELEDDVDLGAVVELLVAEEATVSARRRDFLKTRLAYRIHSFMRRNHSGLRKTMFQMLKLSGSAVAELKQPFVKPLGAGKRVTPEVQERLLAFLQPGDVLVMRHDDAMSNLFLPGFWPHAAFYIGTNGQRSELGVLSDIEIDESICFLEAKKDGVKLRPPGDTLQVDSFTVLRPRVSDAERAEAVSRGLTHAGKLYDFIFDFAAADRLACTELVYRSYHSVGSIAFELQAHAGRPCLSAEDLLNQAVGGGWFEPVLIFGVAKREWVEGAEARVILEQSFASKF